MVPIKRMEKREHKPPKRQQYSQPQCRQLPSAATHLIPPPTARRRRCISAKIGFKSRDFGLPSRRNCNAIAWLRPASADHQADKWPEEKSGKQTERLDRMRMSCQPTAKHPGRPFHQNKMEIKQRRHTRRLGRKQSGRRFRRPSPKRLIRLAFQMLHTNDTADRSQTHVFCFICERHRLCWVRRKSRIDGR